MPRYYVKLGVARTLEDLPGSATTPLTYNGAQVYYLGSNGSLTPFQRYVDFWDAGNDLDYSELQVIEVHETRPLEFNTQWVEGHPGNVAAWGVIDTDAPVTPPDGGGTGGGGTGGGGGVTPVPNEPDPPAERYMGRWSDHWVDGNGIVHYYPQSGHYAPLYPVIHQQTLAQIEQVLIDQNGFADPAIFRTIARWLGIESSADNRVRSSPVHLDAAEAFAALVDAGLDVADALTRTDTQGNFTGTFMPEVRDFWTAQRAAKLTFEVGLGTDPDVAGLPPATRAALVTLLTGHKVFVSEGYNRDSIADRGYFVALEAGTGWADVPDVLASVVGSIGADFIQLQGRGAVVAGPGADRIIQVSGESGAVILAGAGNDRIDLRGADIADLTSHVAGETGRDRLTGSRYDDKLLGGGGADALFGLRGIDTLAGGAGNDLIEGGAWRDVLRGEAGNDTVKGGSGADMLNGGAGRDLLTGGGGPDRFVFDTPRTGQDRIVDFADGLDRIVLGDAAARSMADVSLRRIDANTYVMELLSGRVTIDATGPLTLTGEDILFI